MKKERGRLGLLAVLILALAGLLLTTAGAVGRPVDIYINGDLLNIPPSYGAPFYDENSRLQIPMRYIIESCGYDVVWNNAQQTATVPTQSGDVVITLGSKVLRTPEGEVAMDTSAVARDNRTYLPLRFALEALGFQVTWTGGGTADRVDITGQVGAASGRVTMTAAEVAALASPATFYIEVSDSNGVPYAGGSGFFIDPSGVGVTNYHVIDGAYYANITTVDGKTYEMGMVLYYDVERDLAVFDVLPKEEGVTAMNVPYLGLATPSSIHNGDVVYAIGSPLGLQNSITDGLVSNKDRILPGDTRTYIQTSAPISHGNSGGPLLNQYGEVVGVNTAGLEEGQNLNFAIPVSDLAAVNYDDSTQWLFLFQVADRELAVQPPVNLHIVRQDENAVYLQWDPVEGAEYYHFYYQEAGDESYWYDEDQTYGGPARFTYSTDYTVQYYGLEKGHTYHVTVTAVKGGAESADSRVLTFQFAGTATTAGQSGATPCYSKAGWLPDFGAIYGLTPVYQNEQDGSMIYFYDVPDFSYVEGYYDILESSGFVFDSAASDTFTTANVPMFFYQSTAQFGVLTDIDPDTGEFIVFFVFE